MSNQVYSSGVQPYLASASISDLLMLSKNVPAAGAAPAYGRITKAISPFGTGLFWDQLNGGTAIAYVDHPTVIDYDSHQNPLTKPYWRITAKTDIEGGATIFRSVVDNVVKVSTCIPAKYTTALTGSHTTKIAIVVMDASFNVLKTYCTLQPPDITYSPTVNLVSNLSPEAVVTILAGQVMAVYVYCATNSATFQYSDDIKDAGGTNTTYIVYPCMLEFTKL